MSLRGTASLFEVLPGRSARATPIVCLHGFLGAPTAFQPVLDHLDHHGTVACVRLPGHGLEPWVPSGASFEAIADAILGAIPFERPAYVMGYSMGARLALSMFARHPTRVAGAVLVGVNPGLASEAERAPRRAWEQELAASLRAEGLPAFVDGWEKLPLFASQRALPEAVREARRAERLAHTAEGIAWAVEALGLGQMPSYWDSLRDNTRPVLLVTGALDTKYADLAQRAIGHWPRLAHRVVEGVGHDVVLEAPADVATWVQRTLP